MAAIGERVVWRFGDASPAAAEFAITNCVVASRVVEFPSGGVGAVGEPLKSGLSSGATYAQPSS